MGTAALRTDLRAAGLPAERTPRFSSDERSSTTLSVSDRLSQGFQQTLAFSITRGPTNATYPSEREPHKMFNGRAPGTLNT